MGTFRRFPGKLNENLFFIMPLDVRVEHTLDQTLTIGESEDLNDINIILSQNEI